MAVIDASQYCHLNFYLNGKFVVMGRALLL